jgi:hypothetical protein
MKSDAPVDAKQPEPAADADGGIKFGRASAPGEDKKYNPWTDTKEAKSWEPVGKAIGDAVDGVGKAVGDAAKSIFQPSAPAAKPAAKNTNQEDLRKARNAERKAETINKTETARDRATAGRAPAPAAKPAVPAAEARKDKAAAGRAPAPDTRNPADAGKFPGAAKAEAAKPTNQDRLREAKNAERRAETVNKTETARDAATAKRGPAAEPASTKKYNPWTDSDQAKSWEPTGKAIADAARNVGEAARDVADRVGRAGAEVAKGVGEGVQELMKPAPKSGKAGARKTKK